jgi:AcrR family transcriptional regulator
MNTNMNRQRVKHRSATASRSKGRTRGRPPAASKIAISKQLVMDAALRLCEGDPLQEISIVRMAREFGVTPALIHYYVGGRDALTSGVMNRAFREIVSHFPSQTGDWRADVAAVMRTFYREQVKRPGIASYVMSHNRYRLIQDVAEGETDYGILFFDRVVSSVRQSGLDAGKTAMFTHLLLQHVLASAHQQSSHQLPGDHHNFLVSRLRRIDLRERPNVHFVLQSFSALTGDQAFEAGLELLVEGIQRALDSDATRPRRPSRRTARAAG